METSLSSYRPAMRAREDKRNKRDDGREMKELYKVLVHRKESRIRVPRRRSFKVLTVLTGIITALSSKRLKLREKPTRI